MGNVLLEEDRWDRPGREQWNREADESKCKLWGIGGGGKWEVAMAN